MTLRISNQVLFDVLEQNAASNTGWELYVYDRDDPTQLLCIIPRWIAFNFTKVLNDTGAGSIQLDMDDADVFFNQDIQDYVINDENLIKFVRNGTPRFAIFNHDETEEPVREDESRLAYVAGRGPGAVLEWATILPPAYPNFTGLPWTWASTPALAAFLDLKEAADVRGNASAALVPTFSRTNDSRGDEWSDSNNMELKPGGNLLSILRRFAEAGRADWEVKPDLSLVVQQDFGFHRENTVRFFVADSQLTMKKVRTRRGISNVVYTISANDQVPFVQDLDSTDQWGRREVLAEVSNAQDSITAQQFGQIILEGNKDEVLSATFTVLPDRPGREVFVDYDVGDWIWVEGTSGLEGSFRVLAIGIEVDEDGLESVELTVESALEIRLVQLQKQLEKETGVSLRINSELQIGNNNGGGSGSGGLTKFSKSNVDLGVLEPSDTYTWFTVTEVAKRSMIWRMKVTSGGSTNWAIQVSSQPEGAGELMFEAIGIGDTEYFISWPWVYENQDDPQTSQMYVGIRNIVGAASQFTVVDLRGESLANN